MPFDALRTDNANQDIFAAAPQAHATRSVELNLSLITFLVLMPVPFS